MDAKNEGNGKFHICRFEDQDEDNVFVDMSQIEYIKVPRTVSSRIIDQMNKLSVLCLRSGEVVVVKRSWEEVVTLWAKYKAGNLSIEDTGF